MTAGGAAGAAQPNLTWSTSSALRGAAYALPAVAVLLQVDVTAGLAMALGTIPAAVVPLAPRRRKRYVAAVIGALAGAAMLTGALLAAAGAWVAVPALFLLAVASAQLAARRPFGVYVMSLCVPLVGAGLSFDEVAAAAALALAFASGAVYAWVVSLLWPETAVGGPAAGSARAHGPARQALMLDYGVRLGLAGAVCAAIGFALDLEHVGWAVTAALIVMRPSPEVQRLRSIGRLASVSLGALAAIAVVETTPSDAVLGGRDRGRPGRDSRHGRQSVVRHADVLHLPGLPAAPVRAPGPGFGPLLGADHRDRARRRCRVRLRSAHPDAP